MWYIILMVMGGIMAVYCCWANCHTVGAQNTTISHKIASQREVSSPAADDHDDDDTLDMSSTNDLLPEQAATYLQHQ